MSGCVIQRECKSESECEIVGTQNNKKRRIDEIGTCTFSSHTQIHHPKRCLVFVFYFATTLYLFALLQNLCITSRHSYSAYTFTFTFTVYSSICSQTLLIMFEKEFFSSFFLFLLLVFILLFCVCIFLSSLFYFVLLNAHIVYIWNGRFTEYLIISCIFYGFFSSRWSVNQLWANVETKAKCF